jgi:hypothetical protein
MSDRPERDDEGFPAWLLDERWWWDDADEDEPEAGRTGRIEDQRQGDMFDGRL